MDYQGELAELSADTIKRLDKSLPANWSRANPVDIIGDASPERYQDCGQSGRRRPGTDVRCRVELSRQASRRLKTPPRAVASLAQSGRIAGKPVLTCWLGEHAARDGRRVLVEAGVASYETPEDVATAVSYLDEWSRAQKALMRVPASRSEDVAATGKPSLPYFGRRREKDGEC